MGWRTKDRGNANKKRKLKEQRQGGRNFGACVPHPWKLSTRQPVVKRCCGQLLRRRAAVKLNSQAPSSHVEKNQSLPQNRRQRKTHGSSIFCSHYRKGISTIRGLNVCLFGVWTLWGMWLFVTQETEFLTWPWAQQNGGRDTFVSVLYIWTQVLQTICIWGEQR